MGSVKGQSRNIMRAPLSKIEAGGDVKLLGHKTKRQFIQPRISGKNIHLETYISFTKTNLCTYFSFIKINPTNLYRIWME